MVKASEWTLLQRKCTSVQNAPKKMFFDIIHPQFNLVAQSCPTLRDPMDCNTPCLPVHHKLPKSTQTYVH